MRIFKEKKITWHKPKGSQRLKWDYKAEGDYVKERSSELSEFSFTLSSFSKHLISLGIHEIRNGDLRKTILNFQIAHLSSSWHWYGMFREGPHEVRIPGIPPFTCGQMQPNIDVNLANLSNAIQLAIVLRDKNAIKEVYATVLHKKLSDRGGVNFDNWVIQEIEFIKLIFLDTARAVKHLENTISALKKFESKLEPGEMGDYVGMGLQLWKLALTSKDSEGFNTQFKKYLLARKKYYTATPDRRNIIQGYFDLFGTAAAAYAYDQGMEIKIKSDYTPQFLIEGDFERTYWTNK